MASLNVLINMSRAVIDKATEKVPCTIDGKRCMKNLHSWPDWPRDKLVAQLTDLSPKRLIEDHNKRRADILARKSARLARLCTQVISSLAAASEKTRALSIWAQSTSSDGTSTKAVCRKAVGGALVHVVAALEAFGIVDTEPEMQKRDIMDIVWIYLREVYDAVIIIGELSAEPDAESMFSVLAEFLDDIERNGFSFSAVDDFPRVRNPTLTGVIPREHAVPVQYLPRWDTPPSVVHNSAPYGPRLLWNTT